MYIITSTPVQFGCGPLITSSTVTMHHVAPGSTCGPSVTVPRNTMSSFGSATTVTDGQRIAARSAIASALSIVFKLFYLCKPFKLAKQKQKQK